MKILNCTNTYYFFYAHTRERKFFCFLNVLIWNIIWHFIKSLFTFHSKSNESLVLLIYTPIVFLCCVVNAHGVCRQMSWLMMMKIVWETKIYDRCITRRDCYLKDSARKISSLLIAFYSYKFFLSLKVNIVVMWICNLRWFFCRNLKWIF